MWRTLVAVLAVTAILLVSVVPPALMYRRLHPDRVPIDDDPGRHGLGYEPISFASPIDGAPLRGWYLAAPRATGRAVVIVPGIDNNRLVSGIALRLAPSLLAEGFDVVMFDLRGEGESGGEPITFGAREQWDVLGAVEVARDRGARRVGVLGYSLGAVSAILAAAASPDIDAVAADSAFADFADVLTRGLADDDHLPPPLVEYGFFLYRLISGTDPADAAPVRLIGRIAPRPVLLIHGSADRTVPPSDSERLLAAADPAAAERWLVPGGGHAESYYADPDTYTARVIAFFSAALR